MNPAAALADHLQLAVSKRPTSLALRHAGQTWTFSEWQAEVQALVATRPTTPGPVVLAGNSLELARHAYACSFQNRPFFPVDRSTSAHHLAHRKTPPLSDVTLIISTSGSEGQARGVLLGNAQLDAAAAASNQRLPLRPGDLWQCCCMMVSQQNTSQPTSPATRSPIFLWCPPCWRGYSTSAPCHHPACALP